MEMLKDFGLTFSVNGAKTPTALRRVNFILFYSVYFLCASKVKPGFVVFASKESYSKTKVSAVDVRFPVVFVLPVSEGTSGFLS